MKNHLLSLETFNKEKIFSLIEKAEQIKEKPKEFSCQMNGKNLLSLFEKPSLRTRISFEIAMNQLGGNALTFDSQALPLGNKESIEDTAKVVSRYVDVVMARMYSHKELEKFAENSDVPVINGLTNKFHPCQVLSDLLTIKEKKKSLDGLKLSFFGDGNNNVTHSLLLGCALTGIDIVIACPKKHSPQEEIIKKAEEFADKSKIIVTNDTEKAVDGADIIYTDSWMSYHIKQEEKKQRLIEFAPFQVTKKLLSKADESVIFMNCLPAQRGYEQTAEVIDGPNSVVFDQAENRMHMQKAILLYTLGLL